MSQKTTAEKFDCVEMKRRIQEKIYEETRGMKPDEFLAYIHQTGAREPLCCVFRRAR